MQATTNNAINNNHKKRKRQARAALVFLGSVGVVSFFIAHGFSAIRHVNSDISIVANSSTASIMRAYDSFRWGHNSWHQSSNSNSAPTVTTTDAAPATAAAPAVATPVATADTSPTASVAATPAAAASSTATAEIGSAASALTPATAALTVSTVATTTVVGNSPSTLNYGFGMAVSTTLLGLTPTQLNAELDDLVALHVGWIRMDFDWSVIEPQNNGIYDLSGYETVINAANAHRINVLGIIDGVPSWASSTGCSGMHGCIPASDSQFAQYASALASRLAPYGVITWEIWNEPNLGGSWNSAADPAQYVQMLQAVYPAIKKANPKSWVITGGLGPATTDDGNVAPTDFLSLMYALGARYYFDAVGDHPYSYPALPSNTAPWSGWQMMSGTTPNLRSIMVANGDSNKKIWATEYGAPTNGPGLQIDVGVTNFIGHTFTVTEALQAEMISQAITYKEDNSWMGPLFIYNYKDLGTNTDTAENFFGIVRYDGSDKPAYSTVQSMLAAGL